jgi:predicted nucleic acid-binding protein
MQIIRNRGHIVAPSHRLDECGDPGNNIFLEYADKAGADYLITGKVGIF